MGQKLNEIYDKAMELGRAKAKMRLAILTGVPSIKADGMADSSENIAKFENALKEIEKEFAG